MPTQTPTPTRLPDGQATVPPAASGTILPILVSQGILTSAQANMIPSGADNATIELYVRVNQLATDEQLLQTYATLYQIPFVRIKEGSVRPEVLKVIPEEIARHYEIVPIEKNGDVISVALASPRRLRPSSPTDQKAPSGSGQQTGLLRRLQNELKIKIAPVFAPVADIRAALNGYSEISGQAENQKSTSAIPLADQSALTPARSAAGQPAPKAPVARPYPVISLINVTVAARLRDLFPRSVVERYQVVAFAEPKPAHFLVAALRPADKEVQGLLAFVQKQNRVVITLYQTDQESLDHILAQYGPSPKTQAATAPDTQLPSETEELNQPQALTNRRPTIESLSQRPKGPTQVKAESAIPEVTADELLGSQEPASVTRPLTVGSPAAPVAPAKLSTENSLDTFIGTDVGTVQDLIQIVRSGNVPKMVAGIISLAVTLRASDIHIEAEKDKIRLRYRIDGELEDILLIPRIFLAPLVSRIKILAQLKIDENRVPQDGRFGVTFKTREIDLRISTLPTIHGEKVVIRILDKTTGVMSLEDMGLDGTNMKRIIEGVAKPYGIILSTGPTGSGKSTTLYAILGRISQPDVNVVTVEDPVEYEMPGINQTQIKPKIGLTFAEGLRSILRQDPNIIMVGEIRDQETAEMATHAALTGHLVLSTLHTNNAAGALPRLTNMGVEPFLITSSMVAIIGQRLVRRVCQSCKTEDEIPPAVIEEVRASLQNANIDQALKDPSQWHFYRGKGCPACNNGYKGRIGIFEVLTMSDQIEALAVKKEPASMIEQQALKEGMITMKQDGLVKALKGLTTIEEVMKATAE